MAAVLIDAVRRYFTQRFVYKAIFVYSRQNIAQIRSFYVFHTCNEKENVLPSETVCKILRICTYRRHCFKYVRALLYPAFIVSSVNTSM